MKPFTVVIMALAIVAILVSASAAQGLPNPDDTTSRLLSFEDLVTLYAQAVPPPPLEQKLDALLATPFVDNSASARGVRPLKPFVPGVGTSLRIVQWNIERGIELPAIVAALSGASTFQEFVDRSRYQEADPRRAAILKQAEDLRTADVIILNEVDWGLKRSGYRFVAEELAAALDMNYAYGVEFVEVDPLTLGVEKLEFEGEVDRGRTRGLHGNAILSRYRLDNVRIVRFKTQGHDWYTAEKKGPSHLEKGKRKATEKAFLETISREVRRGGRMFMVAELADEQFPGGKLSVVNAHLEAKTKPSARVAQLREVLGYVSSIEGPLVMGGDMNTTGSDSTPTSIQRELTRRFGSAEHWLKEAVTSAIGIGLVTTAASAANYYRKSGDPTVRSIPLMGTNRESTFFSTLERYRFADGGRFDFRGDRDRSAGNRAGTLSNSNQRASKGFVTTFQADRSFKSVARLKLDWLFVKVPAGPQRSVMPDALAPARGTTYKELNYAPQRRISDHEPISVDLVLTRGSW